MKIVSFNANGIRARLHQIEAIVKAHQPDVIGIQEIKCVDDAFPFSAIKELGYHADVFGQKGHYGVALLSKNPPVNVQKGFPGDSHDAQRRLITGTYLDNKKRPFIVMNGYFPQGESRDHPIKFPAKRKFYADLKSYLSSDFKIDDNLIILGDMNVAPTDLDIGIGETNAKRWLKTGKCCFLPEEREMLAQIMQWGTFDLYRELFPDSDQYFSWFDYRSKGFDDNPRRGLRIDLFLATKPILKRAKKMGIDYQIRGMEKPSDHAPVWLEIE
jgi:exodeoxyribonuclease-3